MVSEACSNHCHVSAANQVDERDWFWYLLNASSILFAEKKFTGHTQDTYFLRVNILLREYTSPVPFLGANGC